MARADVDGRRILIIVTSAVTANTFVKGFANYLASAGCHVTVVADGLPASSDAVGSGFLQVVSIRMERNPRILRDARSLISIGILIKRYRPDVITYATPKASLLASVASWVLRVPVRVYQLWGLRLETTVGVQRMILAFTERLTSFASTRIIANSPSLAESYVAAKLNSRRKVEVLGMGSSHGVDLERFKVGADVPPLDPKSAGFMSKSPDFVVGFVGRLHPDKGIDTLLEALRICLRDGLKFSLLLIGEDEGAPITLDPPLAAVSHLVGHVADPRAYYQVMDVLVLPSRREGFPNVVLEAAAMGVPAVVSDSTGTVDSVVDRVTGVIVRTGCAQALADSLRRMSEDRARTREMGRAARRHVENNFRQEDVWADVAKVLDCAD
ncbi:glycosyltransferase family 4 protein [Tessaracoccus terricola]